MHQLQQLLAQGVILSDQRVRLEPLTEKHAAAMADACTQGELWKLVMTTIPHPEQTQAYIENALAARQAGSRFAFAVIDCATETMVGTTSYHDILAAVKRVEIGYTWYAKAYQRTHINTRCKYLLLQYAFEHLAVNTVGLRTDMFNFASQRAIERIGAKKDGVLRGMVQRADGSIRDLIMYSIIAGEWPVIRAHLQYLLAQYPEG